MQKHTYIYIYMYTWSRVLRSQRVPKWCPGPSTCRLFTAFLRSNLVLANYLRHFWLRVTHSLGICYFLDDLIDSTHTPSKYLHTADKHIYAMYRLCMYYLFTPTTLHLLSLNNIVYKCLSMQKYMNIFKYILYI